MNEAWRGPSPNADAETARIEALERALDDLGPRAARTAKDRIYGELYDARSKRIDRVIDENWQTLEALAGLKLR